MSCYHPIPADQAEKGEPVKLWPPLGETSLWLPCGNCLGCRSSHATAWARRAQHEASLHPHNTFATLTYSDTELPKDEALQPGHLVNFIKRLRQRMARRDPALRRTDTNRLRYLGAGEYGENRGRPHYHILLFGCGFADLYKGLGNRTKSKLLDELWTHGDHDLGEVTGASANYVAQYTMKKIGTRSWCNKHGEIIQPPFLRMSTKPAIGDRWIQKYYKDLTHGYLVDNGTKGKIPRRYKLKLREFDQRLAEISEESAALAPRTDKERLRDAEIIHQHVVNQRGRRPLDTSTQRGHT